MNINKALKAMQIEPIRKLNFIEVNEIIQNFADCLITTFPEKKIDRSAVMKKMFECEMYIANFPENLGSANYFYHNRSIYYREGLDITTLDDYILHELIHYFQDKRDKQGELDQMGLCYFMDYKVHGMAMNEAAVQYIVSKMLKHKEEEIECCGIKAKTISKQYYPLLCNLIMQMIYLVGEDRLIKSTLFNTDEFVYEIMDIAGETQTKEIQAGFDMLLEIEQQMWYAQSQEEKQKIEQQIKETYEKVQNKILTAYFNKISILETIEEAEKYREKLQGYIGIIGNVDNYAYYKKYVEKQMEKLDKRIIAISRENSRNMLTVVNENKIFAIFRLIKKFFATRKEKNVKGDSL